MTDYGISLRQPRPNDLIGSTVAIAALGTAFEASYGWKLLKGTTVLAEGYLQEGAMGIMTTFVHQAELEGVSYVGPATFEFAGDDPSGGTEGLAPEPIRIPVFVVPEAEGYIPYQVVKGDTLTAIAKAQGGESKVATVKNIAAINRIQDPNRIRPGQLLRIPV
jgi:nucleoid-associated protein YgaU